MFPLEIWGGIECTINRVGENFFNQISKSGHLNRVEDLQQFASLGIKKMRYPFLWEHLAPHGPKSANWSWSDQRIEKLLQLGIEPIAGLVHHGSGPAYTNLNDPDFVNHLVDYALAFAERYPHIKTYTPVNEPLTTARFSGLYGFWYPHGKSVTQFFKALLFQCLGVVKAMEAIRSINPNAELLQTEDMGKIHATEVLQYQADFENERKWLSFDLISGKVKPGHAFWDFIISSGIPEELLASFTESSCQIDIIGINHYLTSERYLDHRTNNYPNHLVGGNGRHKYVDVEAVRVGSVERAGFYNILKETFQRYDTPVALTEVHLGCTREEQVRWFFEAWNDCKKLQKEGFPMKAITAWAMLGTFDWNKLVTCDSGFYESGIFDLKGPKPRPTAVAQLIKDLVKENNYKHPIVDVPGWWHRDERILYSHTINKLSQIKFVNETHIEPQPLIITGASGTLGKAFAKICYLRGISHRLLDRKDLDIAEEQQIREAITNYNPWAIINAAGFALVDEAEFQPDRCFRENTFGPALLASICKECNIKLLSFSSDLVFDGKRTLPYLENHPAKPLGIYGKSKKEAEQLVLRNNPDALMIRTSDFFGSSEKNNFLALALHTIATGKRFLAANDLIFSPTYLPDLVNASLDLLIDNEKGIWNLANEGETSWSEFAKLAANISGLNSNKIVSIPSHKLNFSATRPIYSALGSKRGILLPKLEHSLEKYCSEAMM